MNEIKKVRMNSSVGDLMNEIKKVRMNSSVGD